MKFILCFLVIAIAMILIVKADTTDEDKEASKLWEDLKVNWSLEIHLPRIA